MQPIHNQHKWLDHVGQQYNSWTVLGPPHQEHYFQRKSGGKYYKWPAQCKCGTITHVSPAGLIYGGLNA